MVSHILNIKSALVRWCLEVLSNTQPILWGLILKQVKEHWDWVEKKVLLLKNNKCHKRRKSEMFLNKKLPIAKRLSY